MAAAPASVSGVKPIAPGLPPPYQQQQQPQAQFQQPPHLQPVMAPPPAMPPMAQAPAPQAPAPGPAAAPADPPKKPSAIRAFGSWIASNVRERAKLIVLLLIGGLMYGGYRLYAFRQPYEWSGSVEVKTVSLGSRTGGRVKDVLVHEGQEVKAGTVLVVLEPGELEAKKAIAESELESAEAALEKLSNGARPEEIAQAQARVAEARAAAGKEGGRAAQEAKEYALAMKLYKQGAISAAERDAKLGGARAASGQTAEAMARAKEAAAALNLLTGGTRPEDLRVARANVAVAKAKLEQVTTQIEELSIRAPRDGRVESLTVRPGDMLRAEAPAAKLLEKGQIYVRIYVPETQLGKIHSGQEVPITVDSFPGRKFMGRVEHINEIGEFTPRRLITTDDRASEVFGARVSLLDGDKELRAGMVAFVHVPKR